MIVDNEISISLNDSQRIGISLATEGGSPLNYLSKVRVTFYSGDQRIDLGEDILDTVLIDFKDAFKEVSMHERRLHSPFEKLDLGYCYNIYAYNLWQSDKECKIRSDEVEADRTRAYSVFKSRYYALWLFNDNTSGGTFELTPTFPFLENLEEVENSLHVIKNWLSDYKPILKIDVSREVCESLSKDLDKLYREISFGGEMI